MQRNRRGHAGEFLYENAEWMRDAYVERDLSLRKMAREAGCGLRTIARWMEIHGIPTDRTKVQRHYHALSGPAMWTYKGDNIGYTQAHNRVRAAKGNARDHDCEHCGQPAQQWAYDNADPDQRFSERPYVVAYSLDINRYFPLCIPCHNRFDLAARVSRNAVNAMAGEAAAPEGHT